MSAPTARIGIDCRLAGQRHAGIGRYTENLVRELLRADAPFEWVFFFNDQEQADQVLGEFLKNTTSEQKKFSIVLTQNIRHYSLAEQLRLPSVFSAQKLDLLHVPHFNIPVLYAGKMVVTIHDLLWHEYRGAAVTTLSKWKYWPKYVMYRFTVWCAVVRAQTIFTPSKSVALQVFKYFPNAVKKITVTLEGVEERFFDSEKRPSAKLQKPTKTLLYLGSLYPHKNVTIVLEALRVLTDYTLMIVGARSVFQDAVKKDASERGVSDHVQFLGQLSDTQLTELLHTTTALVQPSLSEGFGLTGLEAMAAGCPVIASDIPVFLEVYQDHAVFFNPHSAQEFIRAVTEVEHLDRQKYAASARDFAHHYSWKKMAEQTLTAYTKTLSVTTKR